jgi:hypothetical protein
VERGRGEFAAFARTPASRCALPSPASTAGGVCGGALRGERRTDDATLACDAASSCAYAEAAPTAAVRGGVALVDRVDAGPPARAGGVSPLSSTFDKTSARSSRALFVPGVRVGGRASSTSSSAPLWRMKSMANRVAGERGGAAPARVATQSQPRDEGREVVVRFRRNLSTAKFVGPRGFIPDVARVASLDPAGGPEPRALAGGPVARLAGRDGTRLVEARHPRVLAHRPQDLGRGERGAVGR